MGRKKGANIFTVKENMTETMFHKFGIFRDGQTMEEGLKEIIKMQGKLSHLTTNNKDLACKSNTYTIFRVEGMLKIAEVVAYGGY